MSKQTALEYIPLEKCVEDPTQPRQSHNPAEHEKLVESIMKYGQIVPGHVQPTEDGFYRIASGARRFRALQAAREKCPDDPRFGSFWAICGGDADERRSVVVQWVCNAFREDIAPAEKALYIARLDAKFGAEIREDLGLTENDWRLCRQVASAPQWLQPFGSVKRHEIVERDSEGRPQKTVVERAGLSLASLVRLMRLTNKLSGFFSRRHGKEKGEELTRREVRRLAVVAQRDAWSIRQLDEACKRTWKRLNKEKATSERRPFANDDKELRVAWRSLRTMSSQQLEDLEQALEGALERVRLAAKCAGESKNNCDKRRYA